VDEMERDEMVRVPSVITVREIRTDRRMDRRPWVLRAMGHRRELRAVVRADMKIETKVDGTVRGRRARDVDAIAIAIVRATAKAVAVRVATGKVVVTTDVAPKHKASATMVRAASADMVVVIERKFRRRTQCRRRTTASAKKSRVSLSA